MTAPANRRIYVACLAAYNSGTLHGRWIDASSDVDDMQADIDAMLAASPVVGAEEYAIHDSEMPCDIHEYTSLADIAGIMATVERIEDDHGSEGVEAFGAWLDMMNIDHVDLEDNSETFDQFADAYHGKWANEEEYISDYIESTGMLDNVPESIAMYFDYSAFTRDMFIQDMTAVETNGGIFVFSNS